MRAIWLLGIGLSLLLAGCVRPDRPRWEPPTGMEPPDPPGVVYVGDSLYMDEAEIANVHWLEYLTYVQRDSSDAFYRAQLPDTTVWPTRLWEVDKSEDPFLDYYLRYPGFRFFPVVGVSYQQAVNFCRWRSAQVNRNMRAGVLRKRRWRDYDVTVEYRLPTVAEWERSAAGGRDTARYPHGYVRPRPLTRRSHRLQRWAEVTPRRQHLLDSLGIPSRVGEREYTMEFNVLEKGYLGDSMRPFRSYPQSAFELEYVYAYGPNRYGLFNMIGNVAELTATEGVAKGGAFLHSVRDFTIRTDFPYDQPQAWLGFRCACTVRVRRKAAAP